MPKTAREPKGKSKRATAAAKTTGKRRSIRGGDRYSVKGALPMYRQRRGRDPVTYYRCKTIEAARENGVKVEILPGIFADPRQVHRPDFSGVFSETHERAGEGKYIDRNGLSKDERRVIGAQFVNPYLFGEGSYHTIVATFHDLADKTALNRLESGLHVSADNGEHLRWENGRRQGSDDALLVTPWVTADELWEHARKVNARLVSTLNKKKSGRSKVKAHLDAKSKFLQNLDVMRRARTVYYVAQGEEEIQGGATPCSMPLEQADMAIDMAYLTYGVDKDGNELSGYFYRMAYGRRTCHVLRYSDWRGANINDVWAFKDEKVRQALKRAQKAA